MGLSFHPVTPERWGDLETLFGKRGATGGCWCMWWRQARSEYDANKGEGNRQALKAIIDSGEVPGILAYHGKQPVGWCSLAPRTTFSALERSRVLKRVDDQPVWSIVCFFIAPSHRRQGVTLGLLQAAVEYARQQGAAILEGYPVEPKEGQTADVFAFTGLASAFKKAGFVEVLRRSPTRPIMRYVIREGEK
ncbi:MAG: GNAT family N-acetyltransferase [Anaerolineales bacterium]|nr:GNAT family N-acetyltransferase [Anaerolineales bacterium]